MNVKPIGTINSCFKQALGTPIQPAFAKGVKGTVVVFPEYKEALKDLEGFERVWLIFWFDRSSTPKLKVVPYMDKVERGLFATRAPARPNPIGLSCVKLMRIEDCTLFIEELDILDGTPLLDIKPYVPRFDSFAVQRQGWLKSRDERRQKADDRFFDSEDEKET
jgi:tRNA-Thr(GGU) m(6)t(6)A37 methyltransferase TsaA